MTSSDLKTKEDSSWEVRANGRIHREAGEKPGFLCCRRSKQRGNRIKTSKYNVLTFIPRNLWEQYHRGIVIYFTCVLIIQCIPEIANLPLFVYLAPFICILTSRALRDLVNDIAHHRSDNVINNTPCEILTEKGLQRKAWKNVRVGDVVCVKKDQFVPADMLLLYSTEPNSLSYVETAGIDGETNLKFRQALPVTHSSLDSLEALAAFDGVVTCEPPNAQIHSFVGVLEWKGKKYPLNTDNLLLRDCRLRNTDHCFGLVIYAGFDTKIMKNSGKLAIKFTNTDRTINKLVVCITVFVIVLCILLGIGAGFWDSHYLKKHHYIPDHPQYNSGAFGFFIAMGYFAIFCSLVPFYRYLSLEIIYMFHNFYINNDLDMYHEESDTPAQARGHSCCDMLGQIQYIFTDKTGTLTENLMTFKKCCIGDRIFGTSPGKEGTLQEVSFAWNQYADSGFKFYDQTLIDELRKDPEDGELHEFFRAIALCHTVMSDSSKETLTYKATSPDEEALVTAARFFGYVFLTRTPDTITISEMGTVRTYSILALMDFTSVRKRMSMLVRSEEGKVKLFSKGADSVILERLHSSCDSAVVTEALESFSEETLRTLCLAHKEVDDQEYLAWKIRHDEASMSMDNRQGKLDKLYEDLEKDLQLLGATAIEDKLQAGVPETMQRLRDAHIKVWMLTGDKKETAVNIAYSSNLLSSNMELLEENDIRHLLESWEESDPDTNMKEVDRLVTKGNQQKALVVTGDFLSGFVSTTEKLTTEIPWWRKLLAILKRQKEPEPKSNVKAKALVELACRCYSVICCRVTPQQKAGIVQLVKTNKKVTTLAIGDGGNDVNMIKTAHIGIGVAGKEGLQAVLASEFSIAQFTYLQSLLLFHGRLSYARISKFLCYTDFKTFATIVYNIWFTFFNAFSSLPLFESFYFLFTALLYTLYPAICMGIFDKDADSKTSRRRPELYQEVRDGRSLGWRLFIHILYSFYTSLVNFFVPYLAYRDTSWPGGVSDYKSFTLAICTQIILAVSLEAALTISTWTWVTSLVMVICVGSYFLISYLTSLPSAYFLNKVQFNYVGVLIETLSSGYVWLVILLGVILSVIPSLMCRFCSVLLKKPPKKEEPVQLFQRGAPRRQSSFAFSYTEGGTRFISSIGHGDRRNRKPRPALPNIGEATQDSLP